VAQPLLVVDVQKGFVNKFTEQVPRRVRRLIESGRWEPLLFTRFVNTPNSPYQRLLDWHDCEGPPETDLADEVAAHAERGRVFVKEGLTGLTAEMRDFLMERRFESITVVGIDTDMCVMKIALDLFDLGIQPIVLADCCGSTLGAYAHLAGLAILSRNIGPEQIRDAEMGNAVGRADDGAAPSAPSSAGT
jgi:nicotinamidase-related amidase